MKRVSTNYYWYFEDVLLPTGATIPIDTDDPVIHIGKRFGAGGGRLGFIWAQDPLAVAAAIEKLNPDAATPIIRDEYGRSLRRADWENLVGAIDEHDESKIGTWFC